MRLKSRGLGQAASTGPPSPAGTPALRPGQKRAVQGISLGPARRQGACVGTQAPSVGKGGIFTLVALDVVSKELLLVSTRRAPACLFCSGQPWSPEVPHRGLQTGSSAWGSPLAIEPARDRNGDPGPGGTGIQGLGGRQGPRAWWDRDPESGGGETGTLGQAVPTGDMGAQGIFRPLFLSGPHPGWRIRPSCVCPSPWDACRVGPAVTSHLRMCRAGPPSRVFQVSPLVYWS